MERLQTAWGLQPPDDAVAAWGARGIQERNHVDFPCDRQELVGDRQDDFIDWISRTAMTWLQNVGPKLSPCRNEEDELHSECGMYHMRVSTNGSYGYVYVVAWASGEKQANYSRASSS